MYIQTSETLIPREVLKNLFRYLSEHFQKDELRHFFKLTPNELDTIKDKGLLDFESFDRIKTKCGFSYANLYLKGLDHECIKNKLLSNNDVIPTRYTNGAFSSKMTSENIFSHIPQDIVEDGVKFLQINPESFFSKENITEKISTILGADLLEYLASCHLFTIQDMVLLGQKSGFYNADKAFARSFQGYSVKECFAKMADEISRYFETSYVYKVVSLDENKAVVRKYFSQQMKEACRSNIYSNKYICKYVEVP